MVAEVVAIDFSIDDNSGTWARPPPAYEFATASPLEISDFLLTALAGIGGG